MPLFGSIPLDPRIRECADAGEPIVWSEPGRRPRRRSCASREAIDGTKREHGVGSSRRCPSSPERGDPPPGLVGQLQEKGLLEDKPVRDAFLNVPREHFVPEVEPRGGLRDEVILTKRPAPGLGSPRRRSRDHGRDARPARAEPGHRVLEIGGGRATTPRCWRASSGRGTGVTVDIDRRWRARSARSEDHQAKVVTGDGREGTARARPYDCDHRHRQSRSIPRAWLEQLRPGGLRSATAVRVRIRCS